MGQKAQMEQKPKKAQKAKRAKRPNQAQKPNRANPKQGAAAFLRKHWVHILISPVLAVTLVTLLHEAAHAFFVLAQGGELLEFAFLPTLERMGHISYRFPSQAFYSSALISLGPYIAWCCCAALAIFVAMVWPKIPFWAGSTLFVWFFAVPMADCCVALLGWLAGANNDFFDAFGAPILETAALCLAAGAFAFFLGFGLQRHIYREQSLSLKGYTLLSTVVLVSIAALGFL